MNEHRACPFCGCHEPWLEAVPLNPPFYQIGCTNCGARGPTTVNDPWECWDERMDTDRIPLTDVGRAIMARTVAREAQS